MAKVYLEPAWVELNIDRGYTPELGSTVLLETTLVSKKITKGEPRLHNIKQGEKKGGM